MYLQLRCVEVERKRSSWLAGGVIFDFFDDVMMMMMSSFGEDVSFFVVAT